MQENALNRFHRFKLKQDCFYGVTGCFCVDIFDADGGTLNSYYNVIRFLIIIH